jgi:hypothetical protein
LFNIIEFYKISKTQVYVWFHIFYGLFLLHIWMQEFLFWIKKHR